MSDRKYKIEVFSDYQQWWRYNIFIMLVELDKEDNRLGFKNLSDHIYDSEFNSSGRSKPEDYDNSRPILVESDPCDHAEAYIYIVANTFPDSTLIKESPPFDITIRTSTNGVVTEEKSYEVNQWGGLTIAGYKIGKP